jgi:hypothetical protein
MTIAALPAAQRRSYSSPTTRRSTNAMSSRSPLQTLRYRLEAVIHAHDAYGAWHERTYAISIRVPLSPLSSRLR